MTGGYIPLYTENSSSLAKMLGSGFCFVEKAIVEQIATLSSLPSVTSLSQDSLLEIGRKHSVAINVI